MQIKELKIKNFKGMSLLKFKPKKINLLVGRNNTGKTSVLEAIDLLFNSDEIVQKYPRYALNLIMVGSEYSELAVETDDKKDSKINLKISKPNEIEAIDNFKKNLLDVLINFKSRMRRRTANKIEFTEEIKRELSSKLDGWITPELRRNILKGSILIVKNESRVIKCQLDEEYIISDLGVLSEHLYKYLKDKFKLDSKTSRGFEEDFVFEFSYVSCRSLFDRVYRHYDIKDSKKIAILIKDLLRTGLNLIQIDGKNEETKRRIIYVESIIKEYNLVENLDRLDFDYVIFKDGSERKFIPFDFLGDGFKAMIGLLWHLSSKNIKNKIVLLDEPETHMHPGYIQELISMLIKFSDELNIQFFISTHSSDFIDLLFNGNFSPEEQKYLEKELLLLKMEKIDDTNISQYSDYNDSKYTKEELLLDLRGI